MISYNTIVTVVGFEDVVMPIIAFKELMTLEESIEYVDKMIQNEEYRTNPKAEVGVYLDTFTPLYSYYMGSYHVRKEFHLEISWIFGDREYTLV